MTVVSEIRNRLLHVTFGLLYDRLAFLHEATGRLVYGPAWDGRRRLVLDGDVTGPVLDLGCGEGKLLSSLTNTTAFAFGVEPSATMARRAQANSLLVVQAAAQTLPLQTGTILRVVATYPGPWILDQQTWDEIARVTAPGGTVIVLLGGDIRRGRWSSVRRTLLGLAYGRSSSTQQLPVLGNETVTGDYQLVDDEWGQAIVWSGTRVGASQPADHPSIGSS